MENTNIRLPRKSFLLARILSCVLPGSGHIYAGETIKGVVIMCISFIWWTTFFSFILDRYESYQLAFWAFSAAYLLYIYGCALGAAKCVGEYNAHQRVMEYEHRDELLKKIHKYEDHPTVRNI